MEHKSDMSVLLLFYKKCVCQYRSPTPYHLPRLLSCDVLRMNIYSWTGLFLLSDCAHALRAFYQWGVNELQSQDMSPLYYMTRSRLE